MFYTKKLLQFPNNLIKSNQFQ